MSCEHRFELTEHTADIGVIAEGSTMAQAFEAAACGMFTIMADIGKYEATETQEVEAFGDDSISLLQSFLTSLLVILDGDNLLPIDFKISEISSEHLKCTVSARPIRDDIEWLGPQVKAVTYHQMSVENPEPGKWIAKAIFDV